MLINVIELKQIEHEQQPNILFQCKQQSQK